MTFNHLQLPQDRFLPWHSSGYPHTHTFAFSRASLVPKQVHAILEQAAEFVPFFLIDRPTWGNEDDALYQKCEGIRWTLVSFLSAKWKKVSPVLTRISTSLATNQNFVPHKFVKEESKRAQLDEQKAIYEMEDDLDRFITSLFVVSSHLIPVGPLRVSYLICGTDTLEQPLQTSCEMPP